MAKRIDIVFGSKIDETGIKTDIKQIEKTFQKLNLKINPEFDESAIKQMQKNLKIVTDEATKLSSLTTSFSQGGVKYDVSQTQSKNYQYRKAEISIDEDASITNTEKRLKSLYRTAIETQDQINNAVKGGLTTYQKELQNNLLNIEKSISSTKEKMSSLGVDTSENLVIGRLEERLDNSKTEQSITEQKKLYSELDSTITNLRASEVSLEKAQAYHSDGRTIQALQQQVDLYKQQVSEITSSKNATEELKTAAQKAVEESAIASKAIGARAAEKQGVQDLTLYTNQLKNLTKVQIELASVQSKVTKGTIANDSATQKYIASLQSEESSLKTALNGTQQLLEGTNAYDEALSRRALAEKRVKTSTDAMNVSTQKSKSILSQLEGISKNFTKSLMGVAAGAQAFQLVRRAIQQAMATIKELDSTMTQVRMVTEGTRQETYELANQYSELAKRMGSTTTEVANGATEWLRQGKSIEDTNKALEASMILSKVGNIEASQSTELLTSTLNGYKKTASDAMHVVDALTAVDLNAATSAKELAEALQNTANMARVNGVEFEQLLGMVGSVSEATRRSASVVGNSFKTIFSRLTNVSAGKDIDDEGESINDVEESLSKVGIVLRESSGEWRNMYEVISEVATKWKEFSSVERDQVSTAMAGTRQRETFLSLMENWNRAVELSSIALNSEGSAMNKFNIYLDSVEAHINTMKTAWQDLVYSQGFTDLLRTGIDLVTKLIEVIDYLLNNPIVQFAAAAGAAKLLGSQLQKAWSWIAGKSVISGLAQASSGMISYGTAIKGIGTAAKVAGSSLVRFLGPVGIAIGLFEVAKWAFDEFTTSTEEYKEALQETQNQIETYSNELQALYGIKPEDRSEFDKKRINILENEIRLLKEREAIEARSLYQSQSKDRAGIYDLTYDTGENIQITSYKNHQKALEEAFSSKDIKAQEEESKILNQLEQNFLEVAKAINEAESQGIELTASDERLKQALKDVGFWEQATGESIDGTTEQISNQELAVKDVTSAFENVVSGYNLLNDVLKDVTDTGILSLDNLNSIIDRYPELSEQVSNYLLGLASTQDVLNALQGAYLIDEQNLATNLINKLKLQSNYYQLLSSMDSAMINAFADEYNLDLDNHGNYLSVKEATEKQLLQNLSSWWKIYYGEELAHVEQLQKLINDSNVPAEYRNYGQALEKNVMGALERLNKIYDDSFSLNIKNSYKSIQNSIDSTSKASKGASEQEKSYEKLLQMTIKMLKKKKEIEKNALKEQLDGYKKVINAQKELLDLQDDEYNHTRELEEKNKNISYLKNRLAEIELDTSAEGTKKRLELEKELSEAEKELEDYQHDYSIEQQKDALDRKSVV